MIVLSPHCDDAVLSCWSLLTGAEDVQVITVFAGLPPAGARLESWDRITGAADPRSRMEERRREDRRALALAGREPVLLDFLEQPYRETEPAVAELASAIATHVARHALVYAPAAIKRHPDHVLTRAAALSLGVDVGLYAELPYATRFGWPAWMTGREDGDVDIDAYWGAYLDGRPTALPLSLAQRRSKLRAMRTYRSQFAGLDGGPQRRLSHPALLAFEARWDVGSGQPRR